MTLIAKAVWSGTLCLRCFPLSTGLLAATTVDGSEYIRDGSYATYSFLIGHMFLLISSVAGSVLARFETMTALDCAKNVW